MADWCGNSRTNYFKVKDAEAFKEFVESMEGCVLIKDKQERVGMTASNTDEGCFPFIVEKDGKHYPFLAILAEHLAVGEVAIMMESGSEKQNYITGGATAITWDKRSITIDIRDIYSRIKEELGLDFTLAEY